MYIVCQLLIPILILFDLIFIILLESPWRGPFKTDLIIHFLTISHSKVKAFIILPSNIICYIVLNTYWNKYIISNKKEYMICIQDLHGI